MGLYGEEMLMRTACIQSTLRPGQYSGYRVTGAARIGVDVNLQHWQVDVRAGGKLLHGSGGLDREAATGEAAGAAASPTQKITYMVGKWQIMRLLGKYRDKQGPTSLGQFHDDLIKNGSLRFR